MDRKRYPEHEAKHPWLTRLLNAYGLCDEAVRRDIRLETERRGAPPACGPGCRVCCVGQVVPVSAFEALGVCWYVVELLEDEARGQVRAHLQGKEDFPACAFLVRGACAVYPLRPLVCRRHYVFGQPCRPGENLRETRPGDVFSAGTEALRDMAWELMPLHGVAEEDIDWRFESGYISERSRDLHTLPLWNMITHMDAATRRKRTTDA